MSTTSFTSPLAPSFGTPSLNTVDNAPSDVNSMVGLLPPTPPAPSVKSTSNPSGSKRRGPNSHRVRNMFDSITERRTPLNDVINKHNVSVHVIRQSKRFDPFAERGQVVIKTLSDDISGSKVTYIWRVQPTT